MLCALSFGLCALCIVSCALCFVLCVVCFVLCSVGGGGGVGSYCGGVWCFDNNGHDASRTGGAIVFDCGGINF